MDINSNPFVYVAHLHTVSIMVQPKFSLMDHFNGPEIYPHLFRNNADVVIY